MQIARKLALVSVTAAVLLAAAPAVASTQPAAGTFVEGPETITSERLVGNNLVIELTREVTFTGTYTGVGQADERIVIHADGSTNVHITIAFTGLACGVPAELNFLLAAQGQLDESFETGSVAGHYTTFGPAEPNLRGNGTITGVAGVGGTYEGQVHCD
jgi:hypothetical protein